jgi:hypothetical protein
MSADTASVETPKRELDRFERMVLRIEPGMPMHWYESGRREGRPRAAIVLGAAGRTLSLMVLDPGAARCFHRQVDGSKHVEDPQLAAFERNDQGAWDVPLWIARLFDALDQLNA